MLPSYFYLLPILFPMLAGLCLLIADPKSARIRNIYSIVISVINLGLVILAVTKGSATGIEFLDFLDKMKISIMPDESGIFFAVLVSVLWPFALLYGFEYMEHEHRQNQFFSFYIMTLGAVIGISFSSSLFSLYIFYEVLTLYTFPLVMHVMNKDAISAARKYLTYMLGGAAFSFVGLVVILNYADSLNFRPGGVFTNVAEDKKPLLLVLFVIMFCGFSVKAAMMPFGKWLISAAIAPMPVTGLLHAVAVVKAGAFACIRLIYYVFGADYLRGTWAQYLIMALTLMTVLYGSGMAVKEPHMKRRMAYSTISNLSYILFAASIMTPLGLTAAFAHIFAHAITKLGMFFCVGAVIHITGKNYVREIVGLGRKMKFTFGCLLLLSLSVIGVPQFAGFVSKINILEACIDSKDIAAYIGAGIIIISAILTAIYMFDILIKAFFPAEGATCEGLDKAHDPGWQMVTTISLLTCAVIVLGIFWEPILGYINTISALM